MYHYNTNMFVTDIIYDYVLFNVTILRNKITSNAKQSKGVSIPVKDDYIVVSLLFSNVESMKQFIPSRYPRLSRDPWFIPSHHSQLSRDPWFVETTSAIS